MEDLAKRFPDNSEVLLLDGNRAFFTGQYEKALKAYRRLVACDPSAGETYNMIGYALTELDRFPEAVEAFQKYAFLYPDQCNPHDSLGDSTCGSAVTTTRTGSWRGRSPSSRTSPGAGCIWR